MEEPDEDRRMAGIHYPRICMLTIYMGKKITCMRLDSSVGKA